MFTAIKIDLFIKINFKLFPPSRVMSQKKLHTKCSSHFSIHLINTALEKPPSPQLYAINTFYRITGPPIVNRLNFFYLIPCEVPRHQSETDEG